MRCVIRMASTSQHGNGTRMPTRTDTGAIIQLLLLFTVLGTRHRTYIIEMDAIRSNSHKPVPVVSFQGSVGWCRRVHEVAIPVAIWYCCLGGGSVSKMKRETDGWCSAELEEAHSRFVMMCETRWIPGQPCLRTVHECVHMRDDCKQNPCVKH